MELDLSLPYAIHVFWMGRGYTFTPSDADARNLDIGPLSGVTEVKRATAALLEIDESQLTHFVVDKNEQNSVVSFTVRPQERFA